MNTRMPKKKKIIECDHCDQVFTKMRDYETHRYLYKGEKAHVCDECGKDYASPLGLRIHKNTHTGEKPFKCSMCEKGFTSQAGLNYHKLTHSGERPFVCDTCGKSFRHKAHLQNHIVKHTGVKSHQCEICGLAFYTKKEMLGHQKVHLEGEERAAFKQQHKKFEVPCEVCGKMYHSQTGLETHLKTHTGEKPFSCDVCGKAYTNAAGLMYHQKTHTGEKNHKCEDCGRGFSSHGGLEIHRRTHTGEKPFRCEVCQVCFGSRSNLHAHQRAHTRAWLAAHHEVVPKPVSASALKMRKYREKLKNDPSLTPPSLRGKPRWRPKKPETLRKYREKLKALDRLRHLPNNEAVDSRRFIQSVLEISGQSTTQDNVEAVSQDMVSLLPHNLMVLPASKQEVETLQTSEAHKPSLLHQGGTESLLNHTVSVVSSEDGNPQHNVMMQPVFSQEQVLSQNIVTVPTTTSDQTGGMSLYNFASIHASQQTDVISQNNVAVPLEQPKAELVLQNVVVASPGSDQKVKVSLHNLAAAVHASQQTEEIHQETVAVPLTEPKTELVLQNVVIAPPPSAMQGVTAVQSSHPTAEVLLQSSVAAPASEQKDDEVLPYSFTIPFPLEPKADVLQRSSIMATCPHPQNVVMPSGQNTHQNVEALPHNTMMVESTGQSVQNTEAPPHNVMMVQSSAGQNAQNLEGHNVRVVQSSAQNPKTLSVFLTV